MQQAVVDNSDNFNSRSIHMIVVMMIVMAMVVMMMMMMMVMTLMMTMMILICEWWWEAPVDYPKRSTRRSQQEVEISRHLLSLDPK